MLGLSGALLGQALLFQQAATATFGHRSFERGLHDLQIGVGQRFRFERGVGDRRLLDGRRIDGGDDLFVGQLQRRPFGRLHQLKNSISTQASDSAAKTLEQE